MATGVGLRIADEECIAAIATADAETQYIVRESILHMSDDGDAALGGPVPAGPSHSISGFVAAVGDPAGISIDDGEAYRAEDLVATAVFCLINLAAQHLNGPAEFSATYPADWPAANAQALRDALDYLGLRSVSLVSEADLAGGGTDGRAVADKAALAALTAVLATPAGATPPDPGNAENAMVATDIMPTIAAASAQPQAYSAAIPVAAPVANHDLATKSLTAPPPRPATGAASDKPVPFTRRHRIPILIGAAALIGLIIGGIGVAALLGGDSSPTTTPVQDAKSDEVTVSPTSLLPPPPPPPAPIPPPTFEPEPPPPVTEPAPSVEPTTAPRTTPPPTPTPTTSESPTSTTVAPTTEPTTTTPSGPTIPGWSDLDFDPPTIERPSER